MITRSLRLLAVDDLKICHLILKFYSPINKFSTIDIISCDGRIQNQKVGPKRKT